MRLSRAEVRLVDTALATRPGRQRPGTAWPLARRLGMLVILGWATQAQAQAPAAQGLSFSPYVSAQQTLTDNYDLSRTEQLADAVTRLTAGVAVRSRSGRVRGFLDYSLSALLFASHSDRSTHQNQLTADLDTEWYEGQGFMRATASIQQAALSAFEAAPRADGLPGKNSTELRALSLAPRWQGYLGSALRVNLQGVGTYSNASDSSLGSVSSGQVSAHVEPVARATVSWALDAIGQESGYTLTRSTRTTRGYGSAIWLLSDLDLRLSAQAGLERSNLSSVQATDTTTWGLGLQWNPSSRTKLGAQMEQRSFGKTHEVSLQYRTPRTVWLVSNSSNINTNASSLGTGEQGRAFDLLFAQLASVEPDFDKRRVLVGAELAARGWTANEIRSSSFFRTAATLDDRTEFSALWRGARSTAAVSYALTSSRRADLSTVGVDDLDLAGRVRQRVFSLVLSHRLTPELTGSLSANVQTGTGTLASQSSRQQGLTVQLSGQMGPKDSWSLAARVNRYETSQVPYSENALVATYGLRF